MTKRHCCYIEGGVEGGNRCEAAAEWEVYGSAHPMKPTDSCTAHVGALLDDSPEHRVLPIAE